MSLKLDEAYLCKVVKIEGTTVYLKVEDTGEEGSMMLSEVAAGRIRNLRDYVSLNRKVVCKVLKIHGGHIEFSLRRVTARERDDVLERHKRERAFANMLHVVGEKPEEIILQIKKEFDFLEFFDDVRGNPQILEKFLSKDKAAKVIEILVEKDVKEKQVEGFFTLKSDSPQGVNDIREILDLKEGEIHYLGSSRFSLAVSGEDFKEANQKLEIIFEEIEKRAKTKKAIFEALKEKGK